MDPACPAQPEGIAARARVVGGSTYDQRRSRRRRTKTDEDRRRPTKMDEDGFRVYGAGLNKQVCAPRCPAVFFLLSMKGRRKASFNLPSTHNHTKSPRSAAPGTRTKYVREVWNIVRWARGGIGLRVGYMDPFVNSTCTQAI